MKKRLTRLTAALLAAMLVVVALPATVLAEELSYETAEELYVENVECIEDETARYPDENMKPDVDEEEPIIEDEDWTPADSVSLAATSADFSLSDNGVSFICAREGFSAKCYKDNTQSSIGYGTKCTGSSVQPHEAGLHTITKADALTAMKSQINSRYAPNVRKQTTGITMNQNQFDALVSLCYNTGGGTSIISNSPLVKYLKGSLTEAEARSQYSSYYVKSGGEVLQGLINRRNAEADLFFSGSNSNPTKTFTCRFYANGGSGTMADQVITYGVNTALRKSTFTRTGYTFAGWHVYRESDKCRRFKRISDGTDLWSTASTPPSGYTWWVYTDGGTIAKTSSVNGDVVRFYAQWSEATCSVTYNANGGSGAPATQTKSVSGSVTISGGPTVAKGYSITLDYGDGSVSVYPVACGFNCWNTNAAGTGTNYSKGAVYSGSTNLSLYAKWNNPVIGTLETPISDGFQFMGWYTSPDNSGVQVFENTIISGDTTLYAKWQPIFVNPFVDVSEGKYYYTPVLWAVKNGITNGITATTFEPNTTCTRGQVVTFLWRAAGCPEPTLISRPFTDVVAGKYYDKAVMWAVEKGITNGTSATTFSPNEPCTRGQVVTFLWRAAGKPEPKTASNPFVDVPAGKFFSKAVLWAVEKGITSGMTKTTFEPDNVCTRGQIVTFLYRQYAD